MSGNTLFDGDSSGTSDFIDAGGDQNATVSKTKHTIIENNLTYMSDINASTSTRNKLNNRPTWGIIRYNRGNVGWTFYEQPHAKCTMYNNTVVKTARSTLQFWNRDASADYGGFALKRNIFGLSQTNDLEHLPDIIDGSPASMLMDNNLYIPKTRWNWITLTTNSTYNVHIAGLSEYTRWRTETGQEPNDTGIFSTQTDAQTFVDSANYDYTLVAGSDGTSGALPLTFATNSGTNATSLFVDNPYHFHDSWSGFIQADSVVIGGQTIEIASIDENTGEITLSQPATWAANDPVDDLNTGKMGAVQ